MNDKGIRLQKYLASCGVASRRKSEEIIKNGRVKVNGSIVKEMGYKVLDIDKIEVDDVEIKPEKKVYLVLNKPPKVICSHRDKLKRKTIYDLIENHDLKIFSAGRLDNDSSGLLILTNDGDFSNMIIHPSSNILKEYYVETFSFIPDKLLNEFKNGIIIEDIKYNAVDIQRTDKNNSVLIYLNEGKKREIREVFNYFEIDIKILRRTAIGGLKLEELKIDVGKYKYFTLENLNKYIFKE